MRILTACFAAAVLATACGPSEPESAASGDPLVDSLTTVLRAAELVAPDGSRIDLSDYEGKVVVLDFWETWCVPCLESFPGLAQAMRENPDDFVVVAVSPGFSDTPEDVRAFIDAHPEYPFVWAAGAQLAADLAIEGIPYKVFLDREGRYAGTELGTRGAEEDLKKLRERFAE